jgi:hypothetical protein
VVQVLGTAQQRAELRGGFGWVVDAVEHAAG